jgi:hypothetical protein
MATTKKSETVSSEDKNMTTENTALATIDKEKLATLTQKTSKSGKVKLPNLGELTRLDLLRPEQIVSSFTVNGYLIKPVFVSDSKVELLVFEYNKKATVDKDTGVEKSPAVNQIYNTVVTIEPEKITTKTGKTFFGSPKSDVEFLTTKDVQKMYDVAIKNLAKQPVIYLAEKGMVSKDTFLSTVGNAISLEYKVSQEESEYLAKVFFGYCMKNREYRGLTPKQLLGYLSANAETKTLAEPTITEIDNYTF